MRVICTPNASVLSESGSVAFSLFASPNDVRIGRIGGTIPVDVRRAGIRPAERTWDFLSIALGVVAADFACRRDASPDGWTRQIDLGVSVLDPDFWNLRSTDMESALAFLTGDIWRLEFLPEGTSPPVPTSRTRRTCTGDCVCLLSGGADSLIGGIDLVAQGHAPVFVSQVAQGDSQRQQLFSQTLGSSLSHLQLSHAVHTPFAAERSQRARSIIFLAFGLLAAMQLSEDDNGNRKTLIVPENGFISLNVPLTPLRLGSLSTRTSHPYFLDKVQAVFDSCGFAVDIRNPYQFKTKGEMFTDCKDQSRLQQLISQTTSCGRFGRYGFSHCGRCVPCLVRRAAFARSATPDTTHYHFDDLSRDDSDHARFDDVQSVRYAIDMVNTVGVSSWAGDALNSAILGPIGPYVRVAGEGISELESFLNGMGVH